MVARSDCGTKLFHFKVSASRRKFGSGHWCSHTSRAVHKGDFLDVRYFKTNQKKFLFKTEEIIWLSFCRNLCLWKTQLPTLNMSKNTSYDFNIQILYTDLDTFS